ncbi:MAG: transposase [Candidatus Uhrbacteria bacterium]
MPRAPRVDVGDIIYHALNRANARRQIFTTHLDYQAFERLLAAAQERFFMRILAYCLMPNHWHLVLHPQHDGDLASFMGWMTQAHTQRWHTAHETVGTGHLYQGRYKSFPVQDDAYFLQLCRYVERNPLRAQLVSRVQDWRWSSVGQRLHGKVEDQPKLSDWPLPPPSNYLEWLHNSEDSDELEEIRSCVVRGRPFGELTWAQHTAERLGITQSLRPRGRPWPDKGVRPFYRKRV